MSLTRRGLLKKGFRLGLLQAGLAILPGRIRAAELSTVFGRKAKKNRPSILQGATDRTRTQFSVVHLSGEIYEVSARSSDGSILTPDRIETHERQGQSTAISRFYFSGLRLGVDYQLELKNEDVVETRIFRTLDTQAQDLRFAICSCMDDSRHEPEIWRDLVSQKPDFVLFVGDSVYADSGEGEDQGADRLWRRFSESRATLEIYFSQTLVPIFAVWDDHDFGMNDAGKDYPHVAASQKNFMQFFAMEPSHCRILERGPGVSSRFIIGGQQFLMMDDRSFRIAGKSRDRYAHWGREQEEWALAAVSAHDGFTWIVNGSQVFCDMVFKESFSGDHPVQFEAVRRALAGSKRKVAFISGDVHYSEISQIEAAQLGFVTFELTSSSIHSWKAPGLPEVILNHRRVASTGERNYLLVDSGAQGEGCRFQVTSRTSAQLAANFVMDLEV